MDKQLRDNAIAYLRRTGHQINEEGTRRGLWLSPLGVKSGAVTQFHPDGIHCTFTEDDGAMNHAVLRHIIPGWMLRGPGFAEALNLVPCTQATVDKIRKHQTYDAFPILIKRGLIEKVEDTSNGHKHIVYRRTPLFLAVKEIAYAQVKG